MKASRFTEAQKAFVLKQGEAGTPVAEICRKAGISQGMGWIQSAPMSCLSGPMTVPKAT